MSELVDSLMDGKALVMDLAATHEIAVKRAVRAGAEWAGVKAFYRLAAKTEPRIDCVGRLDIALREWTEAVKLLDSQLRKLDDVLHRELRTADPDGALDCDPVAFARKAAGQ